MDFGTVEEKVLRTDPTSCPVDFTLIIINETDKELVDKVLLCLKSILIRHQVLSSVGNRPGFGRPGGGPHRTAAAYGLILLTATAFLTKAVPHYDGR